MKKKEYNSEKEEYVRNYFKNEHVDIEIDELSPKINICDDFLKYLENPKKIKIKEALKIYYGKNYQENDYEIFLKTKNTNPVLFPHYFYLQVCFVGVIDKLIDIEKEEINYDFFENEINNTKLKVQIKNIYTIEYESEIYNILTKYKIKNYEINFNLYSGSNMYVIEYDKEKIKKYN